MLRRECPCDIDGICPYATEFINSCIYWCGEDEYSYGDTDFCEDYE